jgi:hypothetical protein
MPRGLTEKQKSFAIHLASGMSQSEAYRRAYSATAGDNTAKGEGGRLARNPRVRELIDQLRADTGKALTKQVADAIALDRRYVLENLREVVERCMQHTEVKDRNGKPTGEWTFNAKDANRALELIGKELGMFVERKEVRHGPLAEASDEELDAELGRIASEIASLTGKPLKQVLLDSMRAELALDVTPLEAPALALAGAADEASTTTGGGA